MKVSLITPVDIKYSTGSTEPHIYEYAKALLEDGNETTLLVPDTINFQPPLRKDYKRIESKYRSIPKMRISGIRISLPFKYYAFIYRGIPKEPVIYLPFSIKDNLFNMMTKPSRQKYIVGAHGMHLKNGQLLENHRILESLFSRILSAAATKSNIYHHVLNNAQKDYLIGLGVKEENIFVVSTFIETRIFRSSCSTGKRLKIVHIGGDGKDAEVVISAIGELKKRGEMGHFDFYFIGQKSRLWPDASQSDNGVHYLGVISDAEKVRWLAKMDVIILPSIEAYSRSMLEGLASGLYVLSTDLSPAAFELKSHGAKVDIVNDRSISEYADRLMALAAKKRNMREFNLWKNLNSKVAKKYYDKGHVLEEMKKLFKEVNGRKLE